MSYKYDKIYIRHLGSSEPYKELPFTINKYNDKGELVEYNTIPEHDASANDVDLDSYTNTKGKTVRNRVRHDVAKLEFTIPTWSGAELHKFFQETTDVWFECLFFYEPIWDFKPFKMYRSGTVNYHKYYIHPTDPLKNIYTDVKFSLIEE